MFSGRFLQVRRHNSPRETSQNVGQIYLHAVQLLRLNLLQFSHFVRVQPVYLHTKSHSQRHKTVHMYGKYSCPIASGRTWLFHWSSRSWQNIVVAKQVYLPSSAVPHYFDSGVPSVTNVTTEESNFHFKCFCLYATWARSGRRNSPPLCTSLLHGLILFDHEVQWYQMYRSIEAIVFQQMEGLSDGNSKF